MYPDEEEQLGEFEIFLQCENPDAVFLYTLDGSEPNLLSSQTNSSTGIVINAETYTGSGNEIGASVEGCPVVFNVRSSVPGSLLPDSIVVTKRYLLKQPSRSLNRSQSRQHSPSRLFPSPQVGHLLQRRPRHGQPAHRKQRQGAMERKKRKEEQEAKRMEAEATAAKKSSSRSGRKYPETSSRS